MKIKIQEISSHILKQNKVSLFIKRIDQVHPFVSGNKWYKLKYNLLDAKKHKFNRLLTFGGAYSNHIAATSYAAKENGFKSIGIIRGEKHLPLNPTLHFASKNDMKLYYVSRRDYDKKLDNGFVNDLRNRFGDFYLLTEGGTNYLAIKGATEILDKYDTYDYVCCPVGTGGTISGIINSTTNNQKGIGFPAIKNFVKIEKNINNWTNKDNFSFIDAYLGNGYAKVSDELINFINKFYLLHKIELDAVYTGKMLMGIFDLVTKKYFKEDSSILVIHTGGLQGNKGMSERLGINLPLKL